MQVPGVLLAACQTMSVKHVGSGRASVLAWRRHRMAGPRCARLVSGTFLSLEQELGA